MAADEKFARQCGHVKGSNLEIRLLGVSCDPWTETLVAAGSVSFPVFGGESQRKRGVNRRRGAPIELTNGLEISYHFIVGIIWTGEDSRLLDNDTSVAWYFEIERLMTISR